MWCWAREAGGPWQGRDGEGQRRRDGVVLRGGGSDVGLGEACWPDGACRDCTRRAAAAALTELPSSLCHSLLVSSSRVMPGGQPPTAAEICYCGDSIDRHSNSLEFLKIILNQKFHAANNPKISLEINTVRAAKWKRILFPFYNPRYTSIAVIGHKLTISKTPDTPQGLGWL